MQIFDNSTLRRSKSCAKSFSFIDVHCHLGEERILSNLDKEISDAKEVGIFRFISNALKSDDAIGIYVCKNIRQTNNIKVLIVES